MKNILKIINKIFAIILFLIALYFLFGFYQEYFSYIFPYFIFENYKSEIFFMILSFIPLCTVLFVPYFIIRYIKSKIYKYLLISINLILMFIYGTDYQLTKSGPVILAAINNIEKAIEINNFLGESHTSIGKINNNYVIYINYGNIIQEKNRLLVKLAENGLIDDNFEKCKDEDWPKEKVKSDRLKKYIENLIKNQISSIDGVYKTKVTFIPPDENHNSKFIIHIDILSDFNQNTIEKTISNLLLPYSDTKKEINFTKTNFLVSYKWIQTYQQQIRNLCKDKKYKDALKIIKYINEKRPETFNKKCLEEMIKINEKLSKDPNNYKYYIERGKLQAPTRQALFSNNKICYGNFEDAKDADNAIYDFKKALELNPNAKEVYEPLYIAKLFNNGQVAATKPIYNDDIIEYMLKAADYNPKYEIYDDISEYYYNKGNYYKSVEFILKSNKKKEAIKAKKPDIILPVQIELPIPKQIYPCKSHSNKEIRNYKIAIDFANKEMSKYPADKEIREIQLELERQLHKYDKENSKYFICRIINKL